MFFKVGEHRRHGFARDPFKAFVSPRPIGWISTMNEEGVTNLAPYSFFNAVCSDPPCVMFAPSTRGDTGARKDSQVNIEKTGEFVCSIVSHAQREAMNASSIHLPYGEDEMPRAGLEGEPSRLVRPLRVKGAPAHFECRHLQSVQMPCWSEGRENWVVFGEVIGIHVDESIVRDGRIDVTRYQPVSRLGYMEYATVREVYEMNRPD